MTIANSKLATALPLVFLSIATTPSKSQPLDTKQWTISTSDANCSIYRNTKSDFLYIWITPSGDHYFRLHGSNWRLADGERPYSLVVGDKTYPVSGIGGTTTNGWKGAVVKVDPSILIGFASASALTLIDASGTSHRIDYSSAAQASAELIACGSRAAAISLPADKIPAVRPRPVGGNWLEGAKYPAGVSQTIRLRPIAYVLSVGTDGKPSACSIAESSGSTELDKATCDRLLARARFAPARNAKGDPVTDSFRSRVNWPAR
jgi:hypothetical protein